MQEIHALLAALLQDFRINAPVCAEHCEERARALW